MESCVIEPTDISGGSGSGTALLIPLPLQVIQNKSKVAKFFNITRVKSCVIEPTDISNGYD